ncbi:winged helix-turn-helix domain-containing protein [Lysobacter korlensis]|uniref:Winged helix-turn-helix domain-containing protein n=1 Tax=Lysobacter korlensis TaxID=553636 RepID=A0ABV6RZC3_9GAMM
MPDSLSPAQARRIALAAQGFGRARPATVGTRQLNSLIRSLGVLQLDSVNVFERSHYLPVFARLGAYDKADLDRLTFQGAGPRARYFEYWAHEAAIVPVEWLPLFRWKMEAFRKRSNDDPDSWSHANRPMLDWLRAELAENGPMAASGIEHDANKRSGPWWGWSDVKIGLEVLFRWGEIFSAGRTRFERRYGLAEQVLPPGALDVALPRPDAIRELIRHAATAHGIGTVKDLADYFRLPTADAKTAITELVDAGELAPVSVPGWKQPAFLHRGARIPRRIETTALLSPFDPVVWERDRALRFFDFHYRIEIYTPAPKRVFGYYTLPVLMDDRIVGRIDLKSDRQARVLRVQSAWREDGVGDEIVERIAPLLHETRAWQGLDSVEVMDRGNLADALAAAMRTEPSRLSGEAAG